MGELIEAAEALWHFGNDLVVHVQNDGIAGGFNTQHRFSEQITGYAADDVLGPQAAVSALAVAAVTELPGCIICKHDMLALLISNGARLRIGQLAAGG